MVKKMVNYNQVTYIAAWTVIVFALLIIAAAVFFAIRDIIQEREERAKAEETADKDEFYLATKEEVLAEYYDLNDLYNERIEKYNILVDSHEKLLKKYQTLKDKCRAHDIGIERKNSDVAGGEKDEFGREDSRELE